MVIWLTGLAGSGKSTIGKELYKTIKKDKNNIVYLDGDDLRDILGDYGYSKKDRIELALKRSKIAQFLSSQGIIVIVTTISMFNEIYIYNRKNIKLYKEIYISCSLEELIARDQKSLYSNALANKIKNVIGIDIDFDTPNAGLTINNNETNNLDKKIQLILSYLTK